MKNENKYELIKFEDGDFTLDVNVSPSEDKVWLTQKQMALLFNVSIDNISLNIKNILNEEEQKLLHFLQQLHRMIKRVY